MKQDLLALALTTAVFLLVGWGMEALHPWFERNGVPILFLAFAFLFLACIIGYNMSVRNDNDH